MIVALTTNVSKRRSYVIVQRHFIQLCKNIVMGGRYSQYDQDVKNVITM